MIAQASNLPNIGRDVSGGADLRYAAANAIGYIQVSAGRSASGKTSAANLCTFFLACAQAANLASGNTTTTAKLA